MQDHIHLNALELRRSNEIGYRANSKTAQEKELRTVWIAQIEKEIAAEYKFLEIDQAETAEYDTMSIDDILAELGA